MDGHERGLMKLIRTMATVYGYVVIFYGGTIVLLLLAIVGILWPLISVMIGACIVWAIVRWVNYRGDPRHAKRPPDAP